jgi:myo-inositol-1(or 4)-monophosphatase
VTQADLASQEVVRQAIHEAFPDHAFLGEEQAAVPQKGTVPLSLCENRDSHPSAGDYRWVVDPLDGTTNYVHGMPHYAVSLGLERDGQVLVGAVYDPSHDECFSAAIGRGAQCNGRPLRTSRVERLEDTMAVVGFPPGMTRDAPDLAVFLEAVFRCQSVRRTGCASLNMCYLAAGWFDVFWSYSTKIWDVAAGALIIEEAGGQITAPDGGPFVLSEARFIAAANPSLLKQLREMIARVRG